MNNRNRIIERSEIDKVEFIQKIEKLLCDELEIPTLKSGNIVLRNKKGFRTNEKSIEYSWLINISKSFIGWCWIFSIKFNKTEFRENENPEMLIQGIFTIDKNANIEKIFIQNRSANFKDEIREFNSYDIFDTNSGITLDGVSYKYLIYSNNTKVSFELNNPKSENWRNWEIIVNNLGKELSEKSEINELIEIFK